MGYVWVWVCYETFKHLSQSQPLPHSQYVSSDLIDCWTGETANQIRANNKMLYISEIAAPLPKMISFVRLELSSSRKRDPTYQNQSAKANSMCLQMVWLILYLCVYCMLSFLDYYKVAKTSIWLDCATCVDKNSGFSDQIVVEPFTFSSTAGIIQITQIDIIQ